MKFSSICDNFAQALAAQVCEQVRESLREQQVVNTATAVETVDLIPLNEVASRLRVTKQTLNRWHRQGRLQKFNIGRKVYYRAKDLNGIGKDVSE